MWVVRLRPELVAIAKEHFGARDKKAASAEGSLIDKIMGFFSA